MDGLRQAGFAAFLGGPAGREAAAVNDEDSATPLRLNDTVTQQLVKSPLDGVGVHPKFNSECALRRTGFTGPIDAGIDGSTDLLDNLEIDRNIAFGIDDHDTPELRFNLI